MYTNVKIKNGIILSRYIDNGDKRKDKIQLLPKLFIKSNSSELHKSLFDEDLKSIEFESTKGSNEFVKNHESIKNYQIFGTKDYVCQYMNTAYPDHINYDIEKLKILSIDIETTSEHGSVNVMAAKETITLITVKDFISKEIITFGLFDFDFDHDKIQKIISESKCNIDIDLNKNFKYLKFDSEKDLITSFIEFIDSDHPDIITGYRVKTFDIPYIVNRALHLVGEKQTERLSIWKEVRLNVDKITEECSYEIYGTEILDYYDLYKKFIFEKPEDYKLDTIVDMQLNKKKIDSGYEKFSDFYINDPYRFVIYNIIDVELVDLLEEKLKLIQLAIEIAYEAKVNFSDVYSPIKLWDNILYHYMMKKNVVPPLEHNNDEKSIIGGYVQQPVPGMYDWCVAFDATSLYPSIFMAFNMSPETLIIDDEHEPISFEELNTITNDKPYSLSANGHYFKNDKIGFIPEVIQHFFGKRQSAKKEMIKNEIEYEKRNDETLAKKISSLNNKQMAIKILMNSLYGASANYYFRFYEPKVAEGITTSARLILQYVKKNLDEYFNKIFKTNKEHVIYCDTDSVHICLEELVKERYSGKDEREICKILDKIGEDVITKKINEICSDLGDRLNLFDKSKLSFKREFIATRGVYIAKKRYCLNVLNSEGVDYYPPKLKIMGVEIARSSTPKYIRKTLKEAVNILLTSDNDSLIKHIDKIRAEYFTLPYKDISFPMTCNNIDKYIDNAGRWKSGTPVHVKASILHNLLLKQHGLDYIEPIKDGEKIRFLYIKEPNKHNNNAIAFSSIIPKEFDLYEKLDYDTMFEKSFMIPIKRIIDPAGWETEVKFNIFS